MTHGKLWQASLAHYMPSLISQIYTKMHSPGLAVKCLSWESFSPNDSKKWLSVPDVSNWIGQQPPHVRQYTPHNVNIPFTSTTQIFMAFSVVTMSTHATTRSLNHAVSSQDGNTAKNSSCWHETLHWSFQDLLFFFSSCLLLYALRCFWLGLLGHKKHTNELVKIQ